MSKTGNGKDIAQSKDAIIKAMKVGADRAGLKSFILGFDVDGLITTHIENSPMNSVSRIVIALFQQMCDFEASQGHMSDPYRATMTQMKEEFLAMIKKYNGKFENIRNGGKTKSS